MDLAEVSPLLQAGDYDRAAEALDELELMHPAEFSTAAWPHALHMMAHICAFRLEDARFVYKRTPAELQAASPEAQAAFALLQRLWCKDYQAAWAALQYAWSEPLQPLAAALAERLRQHMTSLVERSYSNVSPAKLAALLGCSEQQALQVAGERGWDLEEGLLSIKAAPAAGRERATEASLQRLAEYVVHLEA